MLVYVALYSLLALGVWHLARWLLSPRLSIPVVGSPKDSNVANAVLEGHRKFSDTPFLLRTNPPRIILPMSLFKEGMRAPETHLSFMQSIHDMFQGRYTYIGRDIDDLIHTLKADLNPNIANTLPLLQDETLHFLQTEVGTQGDWTATAVLPMMVRMIAFLNSRVFIGLPLSRDPTWVESSISYALHVGAVQQAAQKYSYHIRPFVIPFLPEIRKIRQDLLQAREFLGPLVDQAVERHVSGSEPDDGVGTFISWMVKRHHDSKTAAERASINQMVLSFVALHTTSMTAASVLLDLAERPEYMEPLREEISMVISEDGWKTAKNGLRHMSKLSFQKMSRLDSFIKESQRVHPLNLVEGWRAVRKEFTFANGLKVPRGAQLAWPLWGLYNSSFTPVLSPSYNAGAGNPGPEIFDGFRFSKLRDCHSPGGQKHSAVSTSEDSLNFGHGPHACPGRFFAIHEIKTLVVNILVDYDIRIKDIAEPTHIMQGIHMMPNPAALVELKWRGDKRVRC
ncbi:cytochrome P450 [Aspergillus oleicola]